MTAIMVSLFSAACSDPPLPVGAVGHVEAYFGGLAADEPRAALVGRDVLSAGGTAADAVVAMSLAMTVTRPDAAGPGGGGVCVVYSREQNKAETLEFMPHASRTPPEDGRWIATVPGVFRGMFALSARYGVLRWEQLILPAENLARFGVETSRAFASNLSGHGGALRDPRARQLFGGASGGPLQEGERLRQLDLAALLGRIRVGGPGDFHSGPFARQYLDAVAEAGGWLTMDDLRDYRPAWRETQALNAGNHLLHLPPSPALGAVVAGGIWRDIGDNGRFADAEGAAQAILMADTARAAHGAALAPPALTHGSAGALAMDRNGNAAACTLTMGSPFGTGRLLGDTGVIAVAPASSGSALLLAPSVLANHNLRTAYAAATAAGNSFAGEALAAVYARLLGGDGLIDQAIGAPRFAPGPKAGQIVIESRAAPELKDALNAAGQAVATVPAVGMVGIMYCPLGMLERPDQCVARSDPRGHGYAINAEF